jgi:catechol 2,3-dioxygenase-like lactoylglutathione lyase family enzyme
MTTALRPTSLDHVALWVADRAPLSAFLCDHLGMHVIEETESFTLVGVDAKLGKLTLFEADGPRAPGVLERVVLRVGDVEGVAGTLPVDVAREAAGVAFTAPEGLRLGLVEAEGVDFDLDHVVLRLPDAEGAAREFSEMGFERRDGRVVVADRYVRLVEGRREDGSRPLLNHLALLVDSAREAQQQAEGRGLEIEETKDAPNTLAVFVRGPGGVRIEYVEHKPGFGLV